jgi:hypothetical protein
MAAGPVLASGVEERQHKKRKPVKVATIQMVSEILSQSGASFC